MISRLVSAMLLFFVAQTAEAIDLSKEHDHNCRIELLRPTNICPHVTISPEDCFDQASGKKGTRIPLEGAYINYMQGGYAYLVSSRSSVDLRDLVFLGGCTHGFDERKPEESPVYLGHAWVDDSDPYPDGRLTGEELLKEISEHFRGLVTPRAR